MVKKLNLTVRLSASALIAAGSLALPLVAHAQYAGTNGQVYFIYTSPSDSSNSIAAMNSDGTNSHVVVQGSASAGVMNGFSVSPDGSKLAYIEQDTDSSNNITELVKVANADGSSAATVYTAPNGYYVDSTTPRFTSDGSKVVFGLRGGPVDATVGIYSVATTGGSATQLVAGSSTMDIKPDFAISGSHLYYISQDESATPNTYSLNSATTTGGSKTVVKANIGSSYSLEDVKADDSTLLTAQNDANGKSQLFTVNATTGANIAQVTNNTDSDYIEAASYSPDSTKIVYADDTYDNTNSTDTIHGGIVMNADGTGASALRSDAQSPIWTAAADLTAGTYPGLATGQTVFSGGSGGDGGSDDGTTLPETGVALKSLPYVLLGFGLAGVAAIEVTSRVRRAKR